MPRGDGTEPGWPGKGHAGKGGRCVHAGRAPLGKGKIWLFRTAVPLAAALAREAIRHAGSLISLLGSRPLPLRANGSLSGPDTGTTGRLAANLPNSCDTSGNSVGGTAQAPYRVEMHAVGYVSSGHCTAEDTPIQPVFAGDCEGRIEVLPRYAEGLRDIEGFSHIILLYWMHRAGPASMIVTPFLHDEKRGVFATRSPRRPNPIGLSIVRLVRRDGCTLHVSGIDILDGTPVLDIKPYSSRFDCFPEARNGWQESVSDTDAAVRGKRGYKGHGRGKSVS